MNWFKTGLAERCLSSGQTSVGFFGRVAAPQPTLNPYSPSYRVFGRSTHKNHLTVLAARNSQEHVLSLSACRVCPHSHLPSSIKPICWLWKLSHVPYHRHLPMSFELVFHPIDFNEITSACASVCTERFAEIESNPHLVSFFFFLPASLSVSLTVKSPQQFQLQQKWSHPNKISAASAGTNL